MERIILISIFIIPFVKSEDPGVSFVQEGANYTFGYTYFINSTCDNFNWTQNDKAINHCYVSNSGSSPLYSCEVYPFARKVESKLQKDAQNFINGNLTIVNAYINRNGSDEGLWKLICTTPMLIYVTSFKIKIYSKPQNLHCINDVFNDGLRITCQSERIYPQASSIMSLNKNETFYGVCQNTIDSTSVHYNSTCNYTIPVARRTNGTLVMNMTIYPDVSSTERNIDFGESRILTLNIENPSIGLKNCPENDINENINFSCTCERSDNSFISTTIIWLLNGTEIASSTDKSAILSSSASRYNKNFTCYAINTFTWSSRPITFIPSVLYAPAVTDLIVNGNLNNETILENGSSLKIRCAAIGNPEPSLNLMRNSSQLLDPTKDNYSIILEKTFFCKDSGVYVCSANNNLGKSEMNSTVLIKCPQQLQQPSDNEHIFKSLDRGNYSIKIHVFGYPKPVLYKLIHFDVIVLTLNESMPLTDASHKYEIKYNEDYPAYGNVELTIFNMSLKDFGNYTLAIYNGEKGNLTFSFSIEKDVNIIPDIGMVDDFNWPALIGGLATALIVAIISVIIVIKMCWIKVEEDMVDIVNDDVYWIDFNGAGKENHKWKVPVKKYSADYVSPMISASAPPGNYENYSTKQEKKQQEL